MRIFGITFSFLILIFIWIAVPMIITLIYRHFYNAHANRVLANDVPAGRWISPFIVFLISLFAEIFLVAILGFVSPGTSLSKEEDSRVKIEFQEMTQEEIDDSPYACFDGSEVKDFTLTDESSDDFTCLLYTNEVNQLLPQYILRIEYTGSDPAISWEGGVDTLEGSGSRLDDFTDGQPKVVYLLVNVYSENIEPECFLRLYDIPHEQVSASDEQPEPVAEFDLSLETDT